MKSAKPTPNALLVALKSSDPVLVVGDKVMKFDADSAAKAKEFAGQNVKIMGLARRRHRENQFD